MDTTEGLTSATASAMLGSGWLDEVAGGVHVGLRGVDTGTAPVSVAVVFGASTTGGGGDGVAVKVMQLVPSRAANPITREMSEILSFKCFIPVPFYFRISAYY